MSKTFKPRVLITFNTGTRTILSKRDKNRSRASLKAALRKEMW